MANIRRVIRRIIRQVVSPVIRQVIDNFIHLFEQAVIPSLLRHIRSAARSLHRGKDHDMPLSRGCGGVFGPRDAGIVPASRGGTLKWPRESFDGDSIQRVSHLVGAATGRLSGLRIVLLTAPSRYSQWRYAAFVPVHSNGWHAMDSHHLSSSPAVSSVSRGAPVCNGAGIIQFAAFVNRMAVRK